VLLVTVILSVFLTASAAFGASKAIKVGTSDVIHVADGVELEISSNSLNDYSEAIKAEKSVWEAQMKEEEQEWKAIEDDDERKAAELAWEKKWKEYEQDWKYRYEYCVICAEVYRTGSRVEFAFGPHNIHFVTPAVELKMTWEVLGDDIEDLTLYGEGEALEPEIQPWGVVWRIPHFSLYYYRRR
jgi:hypothetical protein